MVIKMAVMLLEWVFTSVFLILVVLALRSALGKRMSAGLRYGLWAVVLVRLLVPVQLFTTPIAGTWVITEKRTEHGPAVSAAPPQAGPDGALALNVPDGASAAFAAPHVPSPPAVPDAPEPPDLNHLPGWTGYLGWAWLAGSGTAALVLLLSNLRFFRKLRRERVPLEAADCPLRVYAAADVPSPCLFGIFRPAVYVTPDAAADPDMLRHVLAHEYTHYRHGDHIWSLLRCAALAAHWWNPLVCAAARLSQRDAELACDEGALKRLGDSERAGYGNTLLALVTAKPRPVDLFRCATTMTGDKKSLKERISRIACAPKRVVWAVAAAVLVTALACVCAFGQAEPEMEQDPAPSADPAVSAEPSAQPSGEQWMDISELLAHFAADVENVPEDVLTAIGAGVQEGYERFLNARPKYYSWLSEDEMPQFDDWRVENLEGPYKNVIQGVNVEIWRVNYEYHADDPDKAENMLVGGMYVREDGWLCPTYSNCTYYIFILDEQGNRHLATVMMANDCGPDSGAAPERFYRSVEDALSMELEQQGLAGSTGSLPTGLTDLNRNGVPEIIIISTIDEGRGQRMEVWEEDELIYEEEGYFAHAGCNALFLYRNGGEDCLLRYHPYMGQGWCTYSYQLFTLSENGAEQLERDGSVEFDINFHPLTHESFDPEAIAAFMDEINGLLANSIQLLNTDSELLSTFEREGRLYDSLWWLDSWESVFVRDESKPLVDNLRAYQAAMEAEWYAEEPVLFPMNETQENVHVWLRYKDRSTQFDADWDWNYQPAEHVEPQVMDLNGDGRAEIVFSLIWGHGTGCLVENLYVFDAETLEQYDASGLNEMILGAIESTGDEDNFYLHLPGSTGKDRVVIPKSEAAEKNEPVSVADSLGLGEYIEYQIEDGQVFCRLGCDASGVLLNYIGFVKVPVRLTPAGGFVCGSAEYSWIT